jgi:hypothetical protein
MTLNMADATLNLSINVSDRDYREGLSSLIIAPDQLLIASIAAPSGDALNMSTGLDLRRTTPPITQIVNILVGIVGKNPLLCAIQVYKKLDPASLAELTPRFSWSVQRTMVRMRPVKITAYWWVPVGAPGRQSLNGQLRPFPNRMKIAA